MIIQKLSQGWELRQCKEEKRIPAQVPGSVYTDLLRNHEMEDPYWKDNEEQALLLMENDYEYEEKFDCCQEVFSCPHVILHFDGLDTLAEIWLNETFLGKADNMHRQWEFQVKEILRKKDNVLRIRFLSPTRYIREAYEKAPTRGSGDAMQGFVHLRKAHYMFGWDWGAHLPDMGIYRPVSLLGVAGGRIDSVYLIQNHENDKVRLEVQAEFEWMGACGEDWEYRVTITDPQGDSACYAGSPEEIEILSPRLWWPNGYGKQPLYTVRVGLFQKGVEIDVWERRIGLRTMTVKREKDQWGESFAFTVNGVSVFSMGADYIPEDHMLGRVTEQTTRTLLEKARFANFNTIRVWGGGYYPEDWFYDICDELGFIVWQDFMFACGMYDLTPEFEANIRQEFIDNIKRLRHHPSLGLWCGNNEMEAFTMSKLWMEKPTELRDYILMFERIIPQTVKTYDPQTFYWPASPSSGGCFDDPEAPDRGDVHYWDVWHGDKPFSEYRKFQFRFVSEFGFQSFPSEKTIEMFTDDEEDKNIFSYIMEKHQRNGAANGKIINYMQQTYKYPTSFPILIYASQLLQGEAIRYGVEHFRRNRGCCMGAVYWQLNDCWPVASWSSVDYGGRLKALHYYARRFFAPVMISCEEKGMMGSGQMLNWLPFEFEKSIRLNVANETMEEIYGTVCWQVRNADAAVERQEECQVCVPALTSLWLEKVMLSDIDIYRQYVSYQFKMDGDVVSEGTVLFSYPKYFRFCEPDLSCRTEGDEIVVSAGCYAKNVQLWNEEDDLILSDNFFDMNAGEKRIKILGGTKGQVFARSVFDIK